MSDYHERYCAFLRGAAKNLKPLKLGVDCSNGMASLFAREVFPGALVINDVIDGRFPAHSPNPLKAEAREQMATMVKDKGLDCGVIFDGDADRAMFLDERGEFVQPDYLIPIVAREMRRVGGESASRIVLHDVRTSRGAIETLREDGFEPVMVPVGHAFAKPKMRELKALCGGELAGHYYFGDFFGCDSGFLAAIRVLTEYERWREKVDCGSKGFSGMMRPIVSRYANSGELNFRVEDKDAAIDRVMALVGKELPRPILISDLDGLRVEFEDGWFNIRKSNTEPYLRLIVEARTAELLEAWLRIASSRI